MAVAEIPAGPVEAIARKERSLFQQSLHRLLQNKMAVISMVFHCLFVFRFLYYRPIYQCFSGSHSTRSDGE